MNPENPYAAPQTIEPLQVAAPLPVAEAQGDPTQRRLFPDWDTARLTMLWNRSRAILDMQVVWLVMCFVVPVVGFVFSMSIVVYGMGFDPPRVLIALCCTVLTFTRFGIGFNRTANVRAFALLMDVLLGLLCLLTIVVGIALALANPDAGLLLVIVLPIVAILTFQTVRSLRSMLYAPELFGHQRMEHQQLREELVYRREHQID